MSLLANVSTDIILPSLGPEEGKIISVETLTINLICEDLKYT